MKAEKTYNNSRFDVYVESNDKKAFIEVKGVTLENNNIVKFPDAKTERGLKHINELIEAKKEGYYCYIIFLVQMNDVLYFTPNNDMHKELGDALINASGQGVEVLAYDSIVTLDSICIDKK
ncbi:MAG: DNA/RNA nuclease SfsA, partial [Peptostreptococcaceae bacterium]